MKINNILKAWASTTLGVLIGVIATAVTSINQGSFSWVAFWPSLGVAALMGLTDAFKEAKKQIDEEK